MPQTVTIGSELPLNQLTELLRLECAMAGFTEILTWALCSHAENFGHLQHPDNGDSAVSISNPATAEFEVCRTSLLPGAPDTSVTSSRHGAAFGSDPRAHCCVKEQTPHNTMPCRKQHAQLRQQLRSLSLHCCAII